MVKVPEPASTPVAEKVKAMELIVTPLATAGFASVICIEPEALLAEDATTVPEVLNALLEMPNNDAVPDAE
jgi:hypothetical protein